MYCTPFGHGAFKRGWFRRWTISKLLFFISIFVKQKLKKGMIMCAAFEVRRKRLVGVCDCFCSTTPSALRLRWWFDDDMGCCCSDSDEDKKKSGEFTDLQDEAERARAGEQTSAATVCKAGWVGGANGAGGNSSEGIMASDPVLRNFGGVFSFQGTPCR